MSALRRMSRNSDASYVQIVRWEGLIWKLPRSCASATNYGLKDGDILKASIVGNVINLYIDQSKGPR